MVFLQVRSEVPAPYKPMQRTNVMHLQIFCLLQCRLYLHAVFSDNICIIPPGFIHPVVVEIHFIGKNPAIQAPKQPKASAVKRIPSVFS